MIILNCKIIANTQIANNIYKIIFNAPEIVKYYKGPGQFISLSLNRNDEHILRRPMSIASIDDNKIAIIFKVFGEVTNELSKLKSDQYIEVLGPLGNTFITDTDNYTPILIGGGIGLSPILNLDKILRKQITKVYTIIGAKTSNEHFMEHDTKNNILLSTDDGSLGITGTVIDALDSIVKNIDNPFIYACGPEIMLLNLKEYLSRFDIPGQFSVESYMACGFGFCQGCAISNDNKTGYSLVCKDGPVFNYNEVKFV